MFYEGVSFDFGSLAIKKMLYFQKQPFSLSKVCTIVEANNFIHFVVFAFLVAAFSQETILCPTNGILIRRESERVQTYL